MLTASQRLDLIDKIGRALQDRYTFAQLHVWMGAAQLDNLQPSERNDSKWSYALERLAAVPTPQLLRVANELGVEHEFGSPAEDRPPSIWRGNQRLRLFLSHVSANKERAHRLKDELEPYGIAAFVAHDDIEPTARWADEIVRGLHTMDAFVAVVSVGFRESVWCNQECGFALGRSVKTISFKMAGDDPPGFMGMEQALTWRRGHTAVEVSEAIVRILWKDERTKARLNNAYFAYGANQHTAHVMSELRLGRE